jgi:hypothetical protein
VGAKALKYTGLFRRLSEILGFVDVDILIRSASNAKKCKIRLDRAWTIIYAFN